MLNKINEKNNSNNKNFLINSINQQNSIPSFPSPQIPVFIPHITPPLAPLDLQSNTAVNGFYIIPAASKNLILYKLKKIIIIF